MLRSILLIAASILPFQAAELEEKSDDSYRLFPRDSIALSVYGEPDISTNLRLSGNGGINIPLLGNLRVSGLSLAEAEDKIAKTYIEKEIFIDPQITLQVTDYSAKEISILGQISGQGRVALPPETATLSIIEAVSSAGGFTRIAKADSVRITRMNLETNEEEVFIVDVESMIIGKSKEDVFYVFPGDIIFVPERLF